MTVPTARLDYGKPVPTPTGHVSLYVPPNMDPRIAQFRVGACGKEPWTVAFIEGMPAGSVFWDLGANVGSYALLAAALGYRTIAVEPAYANYVQLCENARLNAIGDLSLLSNDNLTILPVALGAEVGTDMFQLRDCRPGQAMHALGRVPGGKPTWLHQQRVLVLPVDWLVEQAGLSAPTHIKLDVDGGESAVLEGMRRTLGRPSFVALLAEMQLPGEEAITKRLAEWGLVRTARYDERGGKPIAEICYAVFQRAPGA